MGCQAIQDKKPSDFRILLEEAGEGSQVAFDQLIRQIEEDVVRTALYLTRNLQNAQDVAQAVYIRLVRNRNNFSQVMNFSGWVHSITVNAARDHLRRQRIWVPLELVTSWVGQKDRVESDQFQNRLRKDLQGLSFKQRAVFVLRELQELSTREVAAVLGCAEATVRGHLINARRRLRTHFGELRP